MMIKDDKKQKGISGAPSLKSHPPGSMAASDALRIAPSDLRSFLEEEGVDTAALEIGLALKSARIEAGLTQVEVATRAGMAQSALSDIERGKGKDGPSYRTIKAITNVLGTDVLLSKTVASNAPKAAEETGILEIDSDADFSLVRTALDVKTCAALVKTVLSVDDFNYVLASAGRVSGAGMHTEGSDRPMPGCSFWKLKAEGRAQFMPNEPMIIIGYGGQVHMIGAREESDNVIIASSHEPVAVQNTSSASASVMTIPLNDLFFAAVKVG